MKWLWRKTKQLFIDLWRDLKDWKTCILFLLVMAFYGANVWVPLLLGTIFRNGWLLALAGAMESFWLAPLTPFIPLCVGTTLGIKKILNKYIFIKRYKNKKIRKNEEIEENKDENNEINE